MNHLDLTILAIDGNAVRAAIIEDGLREAGHRHVTVALEVQGIARTIETLAPDVIIIDIENPNRDMMEHLFQLTRTVSRPIAMFVDRSDSVACPHWVIRV
ncbi:AmiR/NasT family two-component response regulator [Peteryoungia aggregata LMG 23059]|uniref:AmiR/NasT family two-component response regulator n=1 Tax=Peteryoungia aggregata LMG 23059 TaxID=1368425 RepID=A0ABU0G5A1_9HYPH|nr:AmiR/NasT family two-component response regulator [Peteryoungia aggregata LMG 23059]